MKKVLFATTALVATTGFAAADVSLKGSAQMGLQGGDGAVTQFVQDIDVTFSLSGASDNGLTFGAAVDLDENAGGVGTDDAGVAIFVSGDFGTLTMGDTDGALDWALTEAAVGNAGSINDDETGHAGFLGSYGDGIYDGQILRYDYTVGDFGVAVSLEMDDTNTVDDGYAFGARYGMAFAGGSVDFGIGYQSAVIDAGNDFLPGNVDAAEVGLVAYAGPGEELDVDIIGVSAAVALDNGLSAGLQYSNWDVSGTTISGDIKHLGLGVGYTFDAVTVSANWGQYDVSAAGSSGDITGWGLAAAYDFGGGLSAHAGYGSSDYTDFGGSNDLDTWSLGLNMSF
ncbi:porin [Roseicyclus amphidinii]|uniref:porin n=1 Tax=Roseicyclus amphidinii TaxID=3034232 RepID=UPI0024E0CD92|nr:porin [Roseicyclus sp. Amp-Y-6]